MVKFNRSVALLAATLSSVEAFAPVRTGTPSARVVTSLPAADVAESPLAPLTVWGEKIEDIRATQDKYKAAEKPDFAPTISAKELKIAGDKDAQLEYFKANAFEIKTKMVENGAVIFRDFDLMKEQDGFVQFYETIGMKTCLDPLHSVSARPTVDGTKGSPVYEAVNKESRKNFFIGKTKRFTSPEYQMFLI